MEQLFDFSSVLILLVAAVLLVPLFQRFRISPVLAYLAAGIVIGPHLLGLIREVEAVAEVAEFGVIFLLFAIGLELSVARLMSMRREVFGLGSLQMLISSVLIGAAAWWLGSSVEAAVVIGGGLAFSSTAMVMQLLAERGEASSRAGRGAFAVLLSQDLAVVPLLAMIPLLAADSGNVGQALGLAGLKALAALVLIFLLGRFLLRPLYRVVAGTRNRELFVGTTLLIVLGTAWATGQAGLSLELGAFLAGLLLAETEYRHQVEGDIRPFRGLFLGLFFMAVGMGIDLGLALSRTLEVAALLAGLLALKFCVIGVLCRLFGFPLNISLQIGLLLAQGGEFAFVLFGLAMGVGLMPVAVGQILMVVVGLSMMATPLLAGLGGSVARRLAPRRVSEEDQISAAAEDLLNHVVVGGFGRVGQTVSRLLQNYDVPYIALDMDPEKVREGRARGFQVFFGDAGQLDVLAAAGVERALMVVMTLDQPQVAEQAVTVLRRQYADLEILVRGRDLLQSVALRRVGASAVIPEALEASLQLSSLALRRAGVPVDVVEQVIEEIRREDYASVVELIAGQNR